MSSSGRSAEKAQLETGQWSSGDIGSMTGQMADAKSGSSTTATADFLPPWRLLTVAVAITILSYFPVGYHHAVLNVAHLTFQRLINESAGGLDSGQLSGVWSVTVSAWQLGAFVGSLNAFWLMDRFGRKMTLMLTAGWFQLLGSVLMSVGVLRLRLELLIVGRLLAGISTGLVCPCLRVFLSECAPDRYRGTVNSFAGLVMTLSIVLAMTLALPDVWGNPAHAPLLVGICAPLAVLQMLFCLCCPSTPKYLYLSKKILPEAAKAVRFYHGPRTEVRRVFLALDAEHRLTDVDRRSTLAMLRLRSVRVPLLISACSGLAYSSMGVDVMDAYSTELFQTLGLPAWQAQLSSLFFNVVGVLGSVVAILVVDRCRRRTLLMSTLLVGLTANLCLAIIGCRTFQPGAGVGIAAVAAVALLTAAYALGPAAVLENLFAEVSPHKIRSFAGTVSEILFWFSNAVYVLVFPSVASYAGTLAVLLYTVPLAIATVYFYYFLPETARKPVTEVAGQLLSGESERTSVKSDSDLRNDREMQC